MNNELEKLLQRQRDKAHRALAKQLALTQPLIARLDINNVEQICFTVEPIHRLATLMLEYMNQDVVCHLQQLENEEHLKYKIRRGLPSAPDQKKNGTHK